jgi:nucleoside-diphosphate-sugar epimerase
MKIMITGSTGFVGKHLVSRLILNGHDVLEITRSLTKSLELFGNNTSKLLVNDPNFEKSISEFKPEVVIHLASYLTSSDKWQDVEKLVNTNILFMSKILNSVSKVGLKLFVNTGTFAEYYNGDDVFQPAYFYASTKTASRAFVDYYAFTYKFKQATVVPYTIYGGKDTQKKIIDIIFDSTQNSSPIDLSPGEQVLDFIHIDDVTDFYLLLVNNTSKLPNKSNFKLGTGVGHTIKQLANLIEKFTNKKANVNWGGKKYRNSDVMYAVANLKNINRLFNWEPKLCLKEGIKKYFYDF